MNHSNGREKLSAVIITMNSAAVLEPCLKSVAFADEILVVDSGSTDNTVSLAESYDARVIRQAWMGYGQQKDFGVSHARHDWVLCVDSDERVSDSLRQSLEKVLVQPSHAAYRMARCNRFMGRWLRHGEGYPDWSVRLFDRKRGRWSDDTVHEKVIVDGTVGTLDGDLLHESEQGLAAYVEKQIRYTDLQARTLIRAGGQMKPSQLVFSPLVRFLKFYVLRGGFRDGLPGFVHIAIGCFTAFLKYAKALELQRR